MEMSDINATDIWPVDRCPVCGWKYAESAEQGCVPDACSMRPRPSPTAKERFLEASGRRDAEAEVDLLRRIQAWRGREVNQVSIIFLPDSHKVRIEVWSIHGGAHQLANVFADSLTDAADKVDEVLGLTAAGG